MDLRTLGNIIAAIVGIATTVVPVLFSLRPAAVKVDDDVSSCGLTSSQQLLIESQVQSTLSAINSSCAFNLTIF